jgi:hypothetical protein
MIKALAVSIGRQKCQIPNGEMHSALMSTGMSVGRAAYAAGLAVGLYKNLEDLRSQWAVETTWQPHMYAINPARDLGPRIVHALLPLGKKRDSGWSYAAVPGIGPLIGAGLAGWFVRLAHL